jgi:hypothetical protein
MTIQEQLNDDLKTAMKAQDALTKDTVRLIRAAMKNAEIEKGDALDDAGALDVLARMAKQYRDSIATYRDNGREDLAVREEAELTVVARYLPEQLGEDEVRALAEQAVAELGASGPQDRGKVMGKLMPQLKGKADGAVVNRIVGELLG